MSRLPVGYVVRLAIVKKVYKTQVECVYTDREGEHTQKCTVPHPHAGPNGGGIFVGIEKNTRVLIATAPNEVAYIVGIIPDRSYYFSQEGLKDSLVTTSSYPEVAPGQICIKGGLGSRTDWFKNGNIAFEAGTGELEADFELSKATKGIFTRTNNIYKFTEASREIEGVIRRDKTSEEDPNDTRILNFLSGESYDALLSDIGRVTNKETSFRTSKISKHTIRNPALAEKRSIVYEYANSYNVRGLPYEAKACLGVDNNQTTKDGLANLAVSNSSRSSRRTDILNLNLRNYNHLIEHVEGTVVDIYGNVLDINRNIIDVSDPHIKTMDTKTDISASNSLQHLYAYLRRSIKYHVEINSRKDLTTVDPPLKKGLVTNNIKEHSRWSFDVDGEGLTKINIPASSETGNIPLLGRYVVSRPEDIKKLDDGGFKDANYKDVRFLPFGQGIACDTSIVDKKYIPETAKIKSGEQLPYTLTIGTAHHDITKIAPSIFSTGGKLRNPNPASGAAVVGPVNTKINNTILLNNQKNKDANAGGRSLHANLDGSAEISIGADTVDRKSLVIDMAGGVISHYGRDLNGRSLIHQTDGDVIIQIGGKGIDGDERFKKTSDKEDRPGRVEIHLNRPGGTSQKIIIDEKGITIDICGNGLIKTTGDLTLQSGGSLLLNSEIIAFYGKVDEKVDGERKILGAERLVVRDGLPVGY